MAVISLDFETFFSKKLKQSLRVKIAEEYCASEHFDPYLVSVCDGETVWSGRPADFCWSALDGQTIVSHNKYFDYTVWLEMYKRGMCPKPNFAEYHCTANLTSYLCNRRALEDAAKYLGYPIDKQYRTVTEGKRWDQFTQAEKDIIIRGGKYDAMTTHRIWMDHAHKWPEHERRLSNQTIAQGMFGVQINRDLLNEYIFSTHDLLRKIEDGIPWLKGAEDDEDDDWSDFDGKLTPTSSRCIAEQCRRVGIPCPPVKSHDEEGYDNWQGEHCKQHPWILYVGQWRQVNKAYKTFLTAKQRIRPDGTMPFALKYFGAHTGRWSGDAKINFQNFRKVPLLVNQQGDLVSDFDLVTQYIKMGPEQCPWLKQEIDFRRLILPRPGKKMILCDLAQIEPRCLAWLSGNKSFLAMLAEGYGVYEAFARTNMGYKGDRLTKEFKKTLEYAMWKVQVLGLGYGAGWKKFITICQTYGIDITEGDPEKEEYTDKWGVKKIRDGYGSQARKVVDRFRASNKQITDLWYYLDGMFKSSIGDTFEMELPSGRKMRYEKVRRSVRLEKDEEGKPYHKEVFTADIGGKATITYGGKLVENLVQATAREVFGWHLLRIEDAGHRVLFSSHDEAITEVDPSVSAADIRNIMREAPPWLPGCPLDAEASETAHYCK